MSKSVHIQDLPPKETSFAARIPCELRKNEEKHLNLQPDPHLAIDQFMRSFQYLIVDPESEDGDMDELRSLQTIFRVWSPVSPAF